MENLAKQPGTPVGFVVRTALQKADWDKRFRLPLSEVGGWLVKCPMGAIQ